MPLRPDDLHPGPTLRLRKPLLAAGLALTLAGLCGPGAARAARPDDPRGATVPAIGGGAIAPKSARFPADLVLRGGPIYTVDGVRSWAEALAVRGEKIVYVGADRGVAEYIGSKTRVGKLQGKMVLPAFQGAHTHPVTAGISPHPCPPYDLKTKEKKPRAVKKYAGPRPQKPWSP